MHENFDRKYGPPRFSNRVFGFVVTTVFLIVGLWPVAAKGEIRSWAIVIAVLLCAITIAVPRLFEFPNRFWTRFGARLHSIASHASLALIYFVAVVPTGAFIRAVGKDLLRRKRDPGARTYWIDRSPPGRPSDSLKNQF